MPTETQPVSARRAPGAGAGLPRRFLKSFLLLALHQAGSSHGYELFETVRRQDLRADLAGVYRTLRTMDRRGLVTSRWEPSDSGPDRRVYTLSDSGRDAAVEAARTLRGIRDGLSAALDCFEAASGRSWR